MIGGVEGGAGRDPDVDGSKLHEPEPRLQTSLLRRCIVLIREFLNALHDVIEEEDATGLDRNLAGSSIDNIFECAFC